VFCTSADEAFTLLPPESPEIPGCAEIRVMRKVLAANVLRDVHFQMAADGGRWRQFSKYCRRIEST
jgi:hypothetical protein